VSGHRIMDYPFIPETDEQKLRVLGSALGFLLLLSVLRGMHIFLKTGNPCDVYMVVGSTIALGVLWQSGPTLVDETLNNIAVVSNKLPIVTAEHDQFHRSLNVVDMHADSLLWSYRDLNVRSPIGHLDVERMIEGNVAIQAFTIVTKLPKNLNYEMNTNETDSIFLLGFVQQWLPNQLFSGKKLINRAIFQCRQLHNYASNSNQRLHIIKSKKDLNVYLTHRLNHPRITAGVLGVEGMHALQGQLKHVNTLYQEGVRMMAPVHFFDNELGGSAHGVEKYGLTTFGKDVIRKMENMSIILDVSHSSSHLLDDIILFSEVSYTRKSIEFCTPPPSPLTTSPPHPLTTSPPHHLTPSPTFSFLFLETNYCFTYRC
jgi:membrane dipeptidase